MTKLAVFVDQTYWFDGEAYSTDEAYILFPSSFTAAFDQIVFVGRKAPQSARKPYVLDHPKLSVCPLPYYQNVYDLWSAVPRLYRDIRRIVEANASTWDAVWVCGPNPIGQLLARQCISLGRPVFLVVRQNLPQQVRHSNRGFKRIVARIVAKWFEWHFRRLARGRTVFTVGEEMAQAYRRATSRVHIHFPCLITDAQLAEFSRRSAEPIPGRLLCVGRLSQEKGYHYLLDALAEIKASGVPCSLDLVGSGPERDALETQSKALGLEQDVCFHGYVSYGPDLFALYRRATALVVPSLSEGFPQVVHEALSIGLPTIATTVGGIPAFLTHRETAFLIPPADPTALINAICEVLGSSDLRRTLRRGGRSLMEDNTLESQRDRMARIIHSEVLLDQQPIYRSALDDYPDTSPPDEPTVSAIVPVYNEVEHIVSIVEALLIQDYPHLVEIWFVDGGSTDGTIEKLKGLQVSDPRVRLLINRNRDQASGINLALAQIESDIVIRLDAHARYGSDVIRRSVATLLKTGAGGVGAVARPMPSDTLIGQSIVAAHKSRFGVGVAKFRRASAEGWVDTIWNGCYWKHVVDQVGPLREDLPRAEDNDFNARVRALGYGLYLAPDIDAEYYPRQSILGLCRQYAANGVGVARALFQNRQAVGFRHLVPFGFVTILLLSSFASVFCPPTLIITSLTLLAYALAALFFTFLSWRKKHGKYAILLPVVFSTLHLSYGFGTLWGFLKLAVQTLELRPFSHCDSLSESA
jgi:glycosyltransferase involved in cell wall biosynthesis